MLKQVVFFVFFVGSSIYAPANGSSLTCQELFLAPKLYDISEVSRLIKESRYSEALEVVDLGLEIQPKNLVLRGTKAKLLNFLGRYEEAVEISTKRLSEEPNDLYALAQLTESLIELKRYAEALEVNSRKLQLGMDSSTLIQRLRILLKQQDSKRALEVADQILTLDPGNTKVIEKRWEILSLLGSHQERVHAIGELIKLKGQTPYLQRLQIKIYFEAKKQDEAALLVEQYLQLNPENAYALEFKVKILVAWNKKDEAFKTTEQLLRVSPDNPYGLSIKMQILKEENRLSSALEVAEQLLLLQPKNTHALLVKTHVLIKKHRLDEALIAIDSILSRSPELSLAIGQKFRILLRLGRTAEAEATLQQLPATNRYRPFYEAQLYIATNRPELAIEALKGLEINDPGVIWTRAHAYYSAGNMSMARAELLKLIQISRTPNYKTIAALIKIANSGDRPQADPLVQALIKSLDLQQILKISQMNDRLFWVYEPPESTEATPESMNNPFWSKLYDNPVDRATFHRTK